MNRAVCIAKLFESVKDKLESNVNVTGRRSYLIHRVRSTSLCITPFVDSVNMKYFMTARLKKLSLIREKTYSRQ